MLALTVWKDITAKSYGTLHAEVDLGYKIGHNSLQHNIQVVRKLLGNWGLSTIVPGSAQEWEENAKRIKVPKVMAHVKGRAFLWIDSTDFGRQKWKGYSTKSTWHSFKLNGPGRRYMAIRDGRGRVRALWGGYTPKLYDGHFVELNKRELDQKFKGANILGDDHFTYGVSKLKEATLLTARSGRKEDPEMIEEMQGDESLSSPPPDPYEFEPNIPITKPTKDKESWDHAIKSMRARIEGLFGWLKNTFKALNMPFSESFNQQDALVYYAVGVYNRKI